MEFKEKLRVLREKSEEFLRVLDLSFSFPSIAQACHYALSSPGKRLRPILCLASAEFSSLDEGKIQDVLCAIELLHVASLIHDDLPALDDDVLRRGRPTAHVVYGEGMALLAGDALIARAFSLIVSSARLQTEEKLLFIDLLSSAFLKLCEGQAIDISSNAKKDKTLLLDCHKKKTGALIEASVTSAAIISNFSDEEFSKEQALAALRSYALNLGLLFQITDDILDVTSETTELGKTVGSDLERAAQTYVSVYGLSGARELARHHHAEAKKALSLKALKERAGFFLSFSDFVLERKK